MSGIVSEFVTDLRSQPSAAVFSFDKDPLQESQLLYGEQVVIKERQGEWLSVEAVEQRRYRDATGWTGYPGWVKADHVREVAQLPGYNLVVTKPWVTVRQAPQGEKLLELSMGTQLQGIQEIDEWWSVRLVDGQVGYLSKSVVRPIKNSDLLPQALVETGVSLLGQPYLWGGRSSYQPAQQTALTSCDCSGFINLIHRVWGISIARDAHDQFRQCTPCEPKDLQIADLIFLAPVEKPQRMTHVMLYAGGDAFIDANGTQGKTVSSSAQERFGQPFSTISNGDQLGNKYRVHFGKVIKA